MTFRQYLIFIEHFDNCPLSGDPERSNGWGGTVAVVAVECNNKKRAPRLNRKGSTIIYC